MCYLITYCCFKALQKEERDENGNRIDPDTLNDNTEKAKLIQRAATRVVFSILMFLFISTNVVFNTAYTAPICSFSFEQYDRVVVTLHDIHFCERAVSVGEDWASWKSCPSTLNASYNFTERYECPSMQSQIKATTVIMFTTLWLYTAVLAMFSVFVVLSLIQSLLTIRKDLCCRSVKIFFKRISSLLTSILTLLLCCVPLFSILLSVPAFLTIGLSMSRLCRSANDGMFVRPLYHRRNFEFGSGSKLVIVGAVLCWIATIAAIVILVKARHRVVAITIGNITGEDFEELMSDDEEEVDDFDDYLESKKIKHDHHDSNNNSPASTSIVKMKKRSSRLSVASNNRNENDEDDYDEEENDDGTVTVTIDGVEQKIRLRSPAAHAT